MEKKIHTKDEKRKRKMREIGRETEMKKLRLERLAREGWTNEDDSRFMPRRIELSWLVGWLDAVKERKRRGMSRVFSLVFGIGRGLPASTGTSPGRRQWQYRKR